jgi:hypothetical protein
MVTPLSRAIWSSWTASAANEFQLGNNSFPIPSQNEWHHVNTMLKSANKALREDHKSRHQTNSVDLKWISH